MRDVRLQLQVEYTRFDSAGNVTEQDTIQCHTQGYAKTLSEAFNSQSNTIATINEVELP